jgi:hypothetical protein
VDVLNDIRKIAKENKWKKLKTVQSGMMSFQKIISGACARLNIYYTKKGYVRKTFTVGTAIRHPKQGRTQLFRKDVELDLLEKIFKNPRIHTSKGYQKKKGM